MNLATIKVSGVQAMAVQYTSIPAGIAGATVTFEFTDPRWDGLSKTAVFRGCVTRDVIMTGNVVTVPHETVEQKGPRLMVGVYGVDADENIAIPTLWATLGMIRDAADPSGDPGTDPSLPIWAQLQAEIDALKKTGATDEQIAQAVAEYLEENPIESPDLTDQVQKAETAATRAENAETASQNAAALAMKYRSNAQASADAAATSETNAEKSAVRAEEAATRAEEAVANIPESGGGTVKTVNGVSPDENGNVEITVSGGSTVATVEPADDDIPKFFYGGALPQTKTDTVMPFRYISKTQDISGYCVTKAQGTSSLSYAKKNQTTKFYKDAECSEKMKVDFKGWGEENKFCFKANWIDISHARNVVSARLWGDVVKSRSNYAELPELLRTSPNQGAIDGFPVKVYANGVYQGRYTLNVPKDGWMANMDDENESHCILCGENYVSGCFRASAQINESDWSDELHETVPASIKTRWNEVISFVMNSTDDEFRANLGNYFDIPSLIDYHLFGLASCGLDAYGKNQLYMTYDGQKWIASMYDMDSTWGLYWNGSKFVATDYARTSYEDMISNRQGNLLYIRLEQLFWSELQSRWAELKNGALSITNIINRFERFADIAPADLVKEDYASTTGGGAFTGIPSKDTNNIQQIRAFALARQAWTDEYVAGLTPEVQVPCEGISLDADTLTFTEEGTQTLTATVTPDGCTDTVAWVSSSSSVATIAVDGAVCTVTAVANGDSTITVTCGEYSASCAVSVSGLSEAVACTGIALDQSELSFDGEGTQTLTATLTPTDTTDSVVWVSSNPAVASITVEGAVCTVQSVSNGESIITVTCGSQTANCVVTVSGIESYLYQNYSPAGEKFTSTVDIDWASPFIEADIDLSNCTGTKENILSVGESISGWNNKAYHCYYTQSSRDFRIYASAGTKKSCFYTTLTTTNVVLHIDKYGISINGKRLTQTDFSMIDNYGDGTGNNYITLVGEINALSTVNIGSAEGSSRSNASYNYIKVETSIPCTAISLDKTNLTISEHGEQALTAITTPINTTDTVFWNSSDEMVVRVDKDGIITPVADGTAIVTVTYGEQTASCGVTVSDLPIKHPLVNGTASLNNGGQNVTVESGHVKVEYTNATTRNLNVNLSNVGIHGADTSYAEKMFALNVGDEVRFVINNVSATASVNFSVGLCYEGSTNWLQTNNADALTAGSVNHTLTITAAYNIGGVVMWSGLSPAVGTSFEFDLEIYVNDVRYV